jgi:hypothetical protein
MLYCTQLPRTLLCICLFFPIASSHADQHKEPDNIIEDTAKQHDITLNLRPPQMETERKLVNPAYLNKRLPDSAIAYARIPNIWSSLGTPSGNALDSAVGSTEFFNAANAIKQGFAENIIPEFPEGPKQFVQLLLQYANSPVEITALANAGTEALPVTVLMTASVAFGSPETLNNLLVTISEATPEISIIKALDDSGFAEIAIDKLTVQIVWDKALSRLFFVINQDETKESVNNLLATLQLDNNHSMLKAEKEIDESGTGTFFWIDPPKAFDLAKKSGIPQSDLSVFSMAGVNAMKSAAIGMGTQNSINHLKLVVDMPMMGFRALVPSIKSVPTFNLNGKINFIASLGLPEKSHIMSYITMLSMSAPDQMIGYNEFKDGFTEIVGFPPEELFEFFGQDINVVFSETGPYFAVRLNNETSFNKMLDKLVKDFELTYEQREISGHTYHHILLPSMSIHEALRSSLDDSVDNIAKRILSVPTHLYWEKEDDYLLFSGLPQNLMDRHNVSPSLPANKWLSDTQRVNPEGSLLMLSGVNNGVPESIYRMQLSMLSYFGDLTGRPVDLFKLPTPKEVKLPKNGSYGLKLTSSDSQVAIDFSFEDNPLEFFGGSTYASAAIGGIATMLGIAVQEEYENKKYRAAINSAITNTLDVKKALDEQKSKYGVYPGLATIDLLGLESETADYQLTIKENTGIITIKLNLGKYLGGSDTLIFEPPTVDSTDWNCVSEIYSKYLPESCQ